MATCSTAATLVLFVLFCNPKFLLGNFPYSEDTHFASFSRRLPIGDSCTDDDDCDGDPAEVYCHPVLKTCDCREMFDTIGLPNGTVACFRIRNQIGDDCLFASQCKNGVPGDLSDCLPSYSDPDILVCNCTEGNIHEPGQHKCYPILSLVGDPCEVHAQCRANLTDFSECDQSSHKCSCSDGAIQNDESDKCLPIRHVIGDECSIELQCKLGTPGGLSDCVEPWQEESKLSELFTDKICNCTEEAINEPGDNVCYERREELESPCSVNAQCKVNMGPYSECNGDRKCSCVEDLGVANNKSNYCLPIVNVIGHDCQESQQCTEGEPGEFSDCVPAYENNSTLICNCTDVAINQPGKNKCRLKADVVGKPCLEQVQCTANLGNFSECHGADEAQNKPGSCACKTGSIPSENQDHCLAVRDELGMQCSESQQCQQGHPGELSICSDGTCQCALNATNEPGEQICRLRATQIGDQCQVNFQCKANLGNLSECEAGKKCVCTPEHGVSNQHGNFCLPVINTIGAECLESTQCQTGIPGKESECVPSVQLPGISVCNCSEGSTHEPGRHKCYKVAENVGQPCDIQMQCKLNLGNLSECTDEGLCQCIGDRAVANTNNTKCLAILDKLNLECEESVQCINGKPGKWSECSRANVSPYKNVCSCQKDAVADEQGLVCYKTAEEVGDPCALLTQCTQNLGNLTECTNEGTCKCLPGNVANMEGDPNTRCIPGGILIGRPCFDCAQCKGNPGNTSVCAASGICACMEKYTESIKLDDCLAVRDHVGDTCTEPQQCQQGDPGRLSSCVQTSPQSPEKSCQCVNEAITEAGKHKCYMKATQVGDPCQVGIQCVANLEYSQCLEGHCECLLNNTASSDGRKCLPKLYLNDTCSDNAQCSHISNAFCDEEELKPICRCNPEYVEHPSKANTCIKLAMVIGDSCMENPQQCSNLDQSVCNEESQTCECNPEDKVVSGDGTKCMERINELHEHCVESVQCQVANSQCLVENHGENNTFCICQPELFVEAQKESNKCLRVANHVGEECEENLQCTVGVDENTECLSGICRCTYPYGAAGEKCYMPAKLDGYCDVSEECFLGVNNLTLCRLPDHRCKCIDSAITLADSCWLSKKIGDSCRDDIQCSVSIIGHTFCDKHENVCACRDGYIAEFDGLICTKSGAAGNAKFLAELYIISGMMFLTALLSQV